jgi:hypothetical protein
VAWVGVWRRADLVPKTAGPRYDGCVFRTSRHVVGDQPCWASDGVIPNPYESPLPADGLRSARDSVVRRLNGLSAGFAIVGIAPYVGCVLAGHVCMAGHWHHPPYPWWAYAIDGAWIACFGGAVIFAVFEATRGLRIPFIATLAFLTFSRLSGFLSMLMIPAEFLGVIALVAIVIIRMVRSKRRPTPHARGDPASMPDTPSVSCRPRSDW